MEQTTDPIPPQVSQLMTLDDAVAALVAGMPAPVQKFVTGTERTRVTMALSKKYALHVDQAGEFERAFIFMLLGISTPEEFVVSLHEAEIPPEAVNGLIEDVNKEVFMRLRDEERAQIAPVVSFRSQPPKPVVSPPSLSPPHPPLPSAPRLAPIPTYSLLPSHDEPAGPPPHFVNVLKAPRAPKQVPPPSMLPGQFPEPSAPRSVTRSPEHREATQPRVEQPTNATTRILHTMARDMEALKSGADPYQIRRPGPAFEPTPNLPKEHADVSTAPAPVVPTLRAESERVTQPLYAPAPVNPLPRIPEPTDVAIRTSLKEYGNDPYREPVQ